ncbi:hypothetical protein DPMN_043447 [Dreissena polymorpha]|uniref:Uncharacterized protein n=1 Tax=Dreissena polymorpha TaxID=45954 RepID=A0A9D4D2D4_DREPO|nr:hypothetical protein DPMN_043447 [Dreissena polymorpha]
MATGGDRLLVAAIDFGTTYSGWAFSFKHDFDTNPSKVSMKTWTGNQLVSLKAPTCLLIKPDGKTMYSFGFDAETKYSELSQTKEHKKWYYFRRFKMNLWKKLSEWTRKKCTVALHLGIDDGNLGPKFT